MRSRRDRHRIGASGWRGTPTSPTTCAFFADHDRLVQLSAPLRDGASAPLGTVRYFGDYELLEEIARGGMGVVYKARQVSLNRVVALKMILAGQLASPTPTCSGSAPRPRRPPTSTTRTSCRSTRSASTTGQHYFSMKLIDGGSLAPSCAGLRKRPAARRPGWWRRWRGRSITPTSAASCTAT